MGVQRVFGRLVGLEFLPLFFRAGGLAFGFAWMDWTGRTSLDLLRQAKGAMVLMGGRMGIVTGIVATVLRFSEHQHGQRRLALSPSP